MATEVTKENLRELQQRIRGLRRFIARLGSAHLREVDTLLSVAEGEIERTLGHLL
jgi:hypothetical protein